VKNVTVDIRFIQSPLEKRCRDKIAQCEANIRRFDNSGRDNGRRNYWWRQSRKWQQKLHPWLRNPLQYIDSTVWHNHADDRKHLVAHLSQMLGRSMPKYIVTAFDPAVPDLLTAFQLSITEKKFQEVVATQLNR